MKNICVSIHNSKTMFAYAFFACILFKISAANAACTNLGGNAFEISAGGGLDIPVDCPGVSAGATATVAGDITGQIQDFGSPIDDLDLTINAGVTVNHSIATVALSGGGASITNFGTITSNDDEPIELTAGGEVINRGLIQALSLTDSPIEISGGVYSIVNSGQIIGDFGSLSIAVSGQGTIENETGGEISGMVGVFNPSGQSTLINAGTITGSAGTAIIFSADDNIIELHDGSVINGSVLAGPGMDTFRLGGPGSASFDVSLIGAQYQEFELYEKTGAGDWTITGVDSIEADWTVSEGALIIGDAVSLSANGSLQVNGGSLDLNDLIIETGSLSGTGGQVDLGAGQLTLGSDDSSTSYNGVIAGSGGITKTGSGDFTLTGANTYAGETSIEGGSLINNGVLSGSVTVANGALYGGDGASGALTLNTGGIVAPGNSIGVLTVNGNVMFGDSSTYLVEIAPDGSSDLIAASGAAIIGSSGTVLSISGTSIETFPSTQTFTILTAQGGVTGEFETVSDNLPDIDIEAVYNPTSIDLTYVQATLEPPTSPESPNDGSGASDDPADSSNSPASETLSTSTLTTFSSKEVFPSTLYSSLEGARLFADLLSRRGNILRNSLYPSHSSQLQNKFWAEGFGEVADIESRNGVPGWQSKKSGAAFGYERVIGEKAILGVAGGYSEDRLSVGLSNATVNAWHVGLHAATTIKALSLSGALAYANHNYQLERILLVESEPVVAVGNSDGDSYTASAEAFFDLVAPFERQDVTFGPLATVSAVHAIRGSFAETNAGVLNLAVEDDHASQVVTGLGAGITLRHKLRKARVLGEARLLWERVAGDLFASTVSEIPLANATFTSSSAMLDRHRAGVGASALVILSDRLQLDMRYGGAVGRNTIEHNIKAGAAWSF